MRKRASASRLYQSKYAEPAFQNLLNLIFLKIVGRILAFYKLAVSLGFIFLCPLLAAASCGLSLVAWHWIYLAVAMFVLALAYVIFKMKYYHLHEEYLASLKK